jgi:hypothetical protein
MAFDLVRNLRLRSLREEEEREQERRRKWDAIRNGVEKDLSSIE